MLLNSLDLESILSIYKTICYVFLSPTMNKYNIRAVEAFETLINKRPHEKVIIQNICNSIFQENCNDENVDDKIDEEEDIIDVNNDEYCNGEDDLGEHEEDTHNQIEKKTEQDNKKIQNDEKLKKKKENNCIKIIEIFVSIYDTFYSNTI